MRSAHTVEQVREAEATLMASLPEGTLMARAASGLAHAVLELLGGGYGRRRLSRGGGRHGDEREQRYAADHTSLLVSLPEAY